MLPQEGWVLRFVKERKQGKDGEAPGNMSRACVEAAGTITREAR